MSPTPKGLTSHHPGETRGCGIGMSDEMRMLMWVWMRMMRMRIGIVIGSAMVPDDAIMIEIQQ